MSGLQDFILAMVRVAPDRLRAADPDKLAAKYEIAAPTARFYLHYWTTR